MGSLIACWHKHTAPDQVLHADFNLWHLLHVADNIAGFRPRCHAQSDGKGHTVLMELFSFVTCDVS
jgi:hypothetical protein